LDELQDREASGRSSEAQVRKLLFEHAQGVEKKFKPDDVRDACVEVWSDVAAFLKSQWGVDSTPPRGITIQKYANAASRRICRAFLDRAASPQSSPRADLRLEPASSSGAAADPVFVVPAAAFDRALPCLHVSGSRRLRHRVCAGPRAASPAALLAWQSEGTSEHIGAEAIVNELREVPGMKHMELHHVSADDSATVIGDLSAQALSIICHGRDDGKGSAWMHVRRGALSAAHVARALGEVTVADRHRVSKLRVVFLAMCQSAKAAQLWTGDSSMRPSTCAIGFEGSVSPTVTTLLWKQFLALSGPLCEAHALTVREVGRCWAETLSLMSDGRLYLGSVDLALNVVAVARVQSILRSMKPSGQRGSSVRAQLAMAFPEAEAREVRDRGFMADPQASLKDLLDFQALGNSLGADALKAAQSAAESEAGSMIPPEDEAARAKWNALVKRLDGELGHALSNQCAEHIADPVLGFQGRLIGASRLLPLAGFTGAALVHFIHDKLLPVTPRSAAEAGGF